MAIKIKLTRKQAWDLDTAIRFNMAQLRSMAKRHLRDEAPVMRKYLARDLRVLRAVHAQIR